MYEDFKKWIGDPLDYKYSMYKAAMIYKSENREEGLSIFSRYPIVDEDWVSLGNTPNDLNNRICLKASILIENKLIEVFNTHWTFDYANSNSMAVL